MRYVWSITVVLIVCVIASFLLVSPPHTYPEHARFVIEEGESVQTVGEHLYVEGAISSVTVFKAFARGFGGVQAGTYDLGSSTDALRLAARFARGETGLTPVPVTIPEGSTVREIRERMGIDIPDSEEGFLFPDTYYFLPGVSEQVVIERMRERYEEVLEPLRAQIEARGHTELEIITMASLLEKEARQFETMRMVSGILWKRIEIGMPLQVDAVFGYIYGQDTFSPSFADLEIDSPYNTYKYRGLPPGPIGNPGLNAIKAALDPEPSPYLYYLTGKDGTMHYAQTFEQHVANRKFLR